MSNEFGCSFYSLAEESYQSSLVCDVEKHVNAHLISIQPTLAKIANLF